ncbi:MAG: YIP1 family protein [Gammaproteobacteria bacterium]|nr:YIP1 family protein [Gammaproteobacteria bacterium]
MLWQHVVGFFLHPLHEWEEVRRQNLTIGRALGHTLILGAIPVVSGYLGTTEFGWQIGTAETVKLTHWSAGIIALLYYLVIIAAVLSVGWMIHWMGETYGATQPLARCIVLAAYIPIPLFLVGLAQLYPVLWLNLLIGIPAAAYTVFLLYLGIPVMMEIPAERGFLFASAVLAFGLVGLVGVLAATVILWSLGVGPVFTH